MKYKVSTYITGTLVKQWEVEAANRQDAIVKANYHAEMDLSAGYVKGWDMTLGCEVDEDATEVVDETQG